MCMYSCLLVVSLLLCFFLFRLECRLSQRKVRMCMYTGYTASNTTTVWYQCSSVSQCHSIHTIICPNVLLQEFLAYLQWVWLWPVSNITGACLTVSVSQCAGVWDMRGKQFHKGVEIHSWTLVIFGTYRQCPEDRLRCVCGGERGGKRLCLEKRWVDKIQYIHFLLSWAWVSWKTRSVIKTN